MWVNIESNCGFLISSLKSGPEDKEERKLFLTAVALQLITHCCRKKCRLMSEYPWTLGNTKRLGACKGKDETKEWRVGIVNGYVELGMAIFVFIQYS